MFNSGKNHLTTEDNRGLTLIELLVAVVIFSIAIVPMLYAFVYSTGYNFKAQQTLQSTGIAQAIIEKAKSPGVTIDSMEADILAGSLLDTNVFSFGAASNPSAGVYRIEDVRAVNLTEDSNSRRLYDVEITLTTPAATGNTSVIRSMSDTTANFTRNTTAFTPLILRTEDDRAVDRLVELLKANAFTSGLSVTDSSGNAVAEASWPVSDPSVFFNESDIDFDRLVIRRVINIDCTSSGVNVAVDYYCGGFFTENLGGTRTLGTTFSISKGFSAGGASYTVSCSGDINNASTSYTISTSNPFTPGASAEPFYRATYSGSNTFTIFAGATDALFFYYYPGYESTQSSSVASFYDTFIVNSSVASSDVTDCGGTFDMYFYKQLRDDLSNAELNHGEYNYAPYFDITNSGSGMTVNFYNNLLVDVRNTDLYDLTTYGPLDTHGNSYANKLQSNGTSSLLNFTGNVENKTLKPDPAVTPYDWDGYTVIPYDTVTPLYSVTVNVYKDGEASPIETMSSEVINW